MAANPRLASPLSFWIMVAWVGIVPFTIPINAPGFKVVAADLVGLATLGVAVVQWAAGQRTKTLPIIILFSGWAVLCTASNIGTYPSPVAAFFRCVRLILILSPLALGELYGRRLTYRERRQLLSVFLWSTFGAVLVGTIGYFGHFIQTSNIQRFDYGRGEVARAGGLVGDASGFGHLAATGFSLALTALVAREVRGPTVLVCLAQIVLFPFFFYASLARSPVLDAASVAIACVVLAVVGLLPRRTVLARLALVVAAAIALGGALVSSFPSEARIILSRADFTKALAYSDNLEAFVSSLGSGRNVGWSTALSIASAHPILGVGYKGLYWARQIPGDNVFITTLTELGIFGWVMLIAGGAALTVLLVRQCFMGSDRSFARLLLPVWVGQLVHAQFVDITTFASSFSCLLLLLALGIFQTERNGSRQRSLDELA